MKKDLFVIACVESPEGAEMLIPWAKHFAHSLNNKGLMLLNVSKEANSDWLKQYGLPYIGLHGDWKTAIDGLPTAFGGILAITAVDASAPRRSITNPRTLLNTFRDCKIAYLVVNGQLSAVNNFSLILDHKRESKEKLIWASYLVRFLGAQLTVALPDYKDAGLHNNQTNNLRYLEKIAPSLSLTYTTTTIPAPKFTPPDIVAVETLHPDLILSLATDRRDLDVGDWIIGTPELQLLRRGTPTLLLNQRDDLYVLCD